MSPLTARSLAAVIGGLAVILPYPAAIETSPSVHGTVTDSGAPPDGRTLVPVTDPRCSLVMPTFQTYRQVPVSEANGPPPCAGVAR